MCDNKNRVYSLPPATRSKIIKLTAKQLKYLTKQFYKQKELKSGTVVPPGRRLPSGRALGAATLNLEIARRRHGDPGGERGDGNDACTTDSTFDGDEKKTR
ncbi:hypothetical protein Zmor_017846 [Zophobas morio]|uniref:Uncharacterized protein n=1 Tax=Zophobas morio TaxID=2755281 RepID=A0AA38I5U9_9CUCU|nr:hypothetical protein Zmor_017846 [Zophobas morio]